MTDQDIQQFIKDINRYLTEKRLGDAFDLLRNMSRMLSAWEISDRVMAAEQAYSYMLSYLVKGHADPSRDDLYSSLLIEAGVIRDLLVRAMKLTDTPSLYYGTLRSVLSHKDESFAGLFSEFRQKRDEMSAFNEVSTGTSASEGDLLRLEMLERDIFNRIWVAFPLKADESRLIADFLTDDDLPVSTRALSVSAVMLGLLECFDERRFEILCEVYKSDSVEVSIRALIGIVLALEKYKDINLPSNISNRIEDLRELAQWREDIRLAFVELIRTNDTERISGKLKSEIFPGIQKMGRDIAERMRDAVSDSDLSGIEGNPEWENIISDERVRNNLKELSELQQEGADVFMATFAGLKQFPFFNEVSSWFLPFNPERTAITSLGLGELIDSVTSLIGSLPFVCDSDKYSMLLSLSMMPSSQRSMMIDQLGSQKRDILEAIALNDRSLHPVERKAAINNYVLSIYRFYKLFRRKGDFYNPFAKVANPVGVPLLLNDFDNDEALMSLGEFYFKVGLYDYARMIFNRLDDISMPDSSRYQKLGFCCEKLGDYDAASSYYEQSDLLEDNNLWNLRRLFAVLRKLGRYSEAVSVGERLEKLQPDDAAGNYTQAINVLHKAEFLDETSSKSWRPLAWALFLDHQFDASQSYYDRIMADEPSATDYLNMGHLAWANGRLDKAISCYRQSAAGTSVERLIESIKDDIGQLSVAGVDISLLPLIVDAIIYEIRNNK